MKSHTDRRFRKAYKDLSEITRRQARDAYKLFKQNPRHSSLHFKQVHTTKPIYSVRVNLDCRAVGTREGDTVIWFWIGKHSDYEKLISRL